MRRLVKDCLTVVVAVVLLSGCARKQWPFGKPPSFFFQDEKTIALCNALLKPDLTSARQFIADGAEVNRKGRDGFTPLLWALSTKNKEAIELLLAAGADPNAQTIQGVSLMYFASSLDDPEYLRLALKYGGNPDLVDPTTGRVPLMETTLHDQFTNMIVLVENSANANYRRQNGRSVAMEAALLNRYDMVAYLLSKGADPLAETTRGDTLVKMLGDDLKNRHLLRSGPLFEAKAQVIDLLESNGVDVAELRQLYSGSPK